MYINIGTEKISEPSVKIVFVRLSMLDFGSDFFFRKFTIDERYY